MENENAKIGLMSRIDYGSSGFRQGLLNCAREIFDQEDTHFDVLVGGLVSKRAITKRIKEEFTERKKSKPEKGGKKITKQEVESAVLEEIAQELAKILPKRRKGYFYVMTSAAYDGHYGEIIAKRLTELRNDIRYWDRPEESFPFTKQNKEMRLMGIVPTKEAWRVKYDSAPVDKEVEDYFNKTSKSLADFLVVGCYGSNFFKPKGEKERPYCSVPALHKIEEIRTAENQIGVKVIEISSDTNQIFERCYNFKDLVGKEREFIKLPENLSEIQRKILGLNVAKGPLTIGMYEAFSDLPRKEIEQAVEKLAELKYLVRDCKSHRHDIPSGWVQKSLIYEWPKNLAEDRIVAFGCLHALSVNTLHQWFVEKTSEVILIQNASVLVGAGDFIEGREHQLSERGELIGGANYTQQEKFAAQLIAEIMMRVFISRFTAKVKEIKAKKIGCKCLKELVNNSLVTFIYIPGNHDEWVEKYGVEPLTTFRYELIHCLKSGITKVLEENKVCLSLDRIIESKILNSKKFILPSDLQLRLDHLHMARADTTTLRSQKLLRFSAKSHIIIHANFHIALTMTRWNPDLGQRPVLQLGTIKSRSAYEDNHAKRVDTGIGYLRVLSCKDKSGKPRIMMSETSFLEPETYQNKFSNEKLFKPLKKESGIRNF